MAHAAATKSPLGLAIHTASPELGLAFSNFAGESRYQVWDLGRSLSTHLHIHLNEFIQPYSWADFDFIAVAKGPGGFTGTRMGVVTARTLAQQLNIPLFAVSTLAAIAWSTYIDSSIGEPELNHPIEPSDLDDSDIAVQMPAQRSELHAAIYSVRSIASPNRDTPARAELIDLLPDCVVSQERWHQLLASWHTPYRLIHANQSLGHSATAILELAYHDWQQGVRPTWSTALPFYGQSPV